MIEDLEIAVPEGGFKAVKNLRGGPVSDEEVLENIRNSKQFDIPLILKVKEPTKGSFIFIAGGTSVTKYLNEIRQRKANGEIIATSNNTHDFLIDNGIIPDICSMIDPKEKCKDYIKKPHKDVRYIISAVCNKGVFENLLNAGMNVEKMLVAYGMDDERDVDLQIELYGHHPMSFLTGGTMMGLRAMNLAYLLGYKKIEYYGMDSCFASESPELIKEDDPRFKKILKRLDGKYYEDVATGKKYVYDENLDGGFFYAYKKDRGEDIQIAQTSDGRRFLTSAVLAHQAKQFIKWTERLEGKVEVVCHGDSLNSHMYNLHLEAKRKAFEKIGDRRWTDKHIERQMELRDIKEYPMDIELVCRPILALYSKFKRDITVLDYGCGKGGLKYRVEKVLNCVDFNNYDPFYPLFNDEPEQSDIVICSDVMNYVEFQCIENVLKHIAKKTRYITIFIIRTDDKPTEDTTNYETDKAMVWWMEKIGLYFGVAEASMNDKRMSFVCQAQEAPLIAEKELNVN